MVQKDVNSEKQQLFGYTGRLLRINLAVKTIIEEPLNTDIQRRYLGGSGFVIRYLLNELNAGIDPLGPDNKIIIATGPVTGAHIMGSGRHSLGAKSPMTGGIALSQVGEYWGVELKKAGYDMLIIEGEADKPVYLYINDGRAELKDASHLWGKETRETQAMIREELKDEKIRVAMIGPGAERLIAYGCIMCGLFDAAGRGGLGAVMGSKKLKAIAVRGTGKIRVADEDKLKALHKYLTSTVDEIGILKGWKEAGTGFDMDKGVETGDVPVRNWRDGDFPTVNKITGVTLRDTIGAGMEGCFFCPIRCKKKAKFEEPYSHDPAYGGPEYETLGALGSNLGIDDLKAIVKGNELCNAASIDTISAGGVIAFCMEAFERGLLTKEQTDGIEMTWGNADAMLTCIRKIIERDGFGDILARGINHVAKWVGKGSEKFAMQVKGLDPGQHEPRLMPSMGLGFMVNPHGADHCLNVHDTVFASKEGLRALNPLGFHDPVPMHGIGPRKVAMFKVEYLRQELTDCIAICHLSSALASWDTLTQIVDAVTGWGTGVMELMRIQERVLTAARLFNVREGFTDENDKLPPRFFEPKTSGALSNRRLDREEMERAKRYFYRLMGWNDKGVPLPEKVEELGI
jgi:aldehyde:ferredoxin oxidoreductase